jgi:uncharacterized protein YmfQ (DUF2313 family)
MAQTFFPVIKKLLPKGRAFRLPYENSLYKFHQAQAKEPERICDFFVDVRDSGIPPNVPADALGDWETFLGLLTNTALTDTERNERILSKLTAVGGQGPDYIEKQLQDAGFPVYVYENNTAAGAREYITLSGDTGIQAGDFLSGDFTDRLNPNSVPGDLLANPPVYETRKDYIGSQSGDTGVESGDFQSGEYTETLLTAFEYQISADSATFVFYWFIAGPGGIYDTVTLPADRQNDFESLVYQLKPAHTWVIANVTYA